MILSPLQVICLCGSTKFREEFDKVNAQLTLDGYIVLAPGVWAHSDPEHAKMLEDHPELKFKLDKLHHHKIDLAGQVMIIVVDNYIGPSTLAEIEYAAARGKPVTYHRIYTPSPRENTNG